MWGHERLWMPPEGRAEARKLRIKAAASGLRKPVNVIEGASGHGTPQAPVSGAAWSSREPMYPTGNQR
jgi:hypothetical protein